MKKLANILDNKHIQSVHGSADMEISGLALDSRMVQPGYLFAALPGTLADGKAYIHAALEKGAVAIICDELPTETREGITYIISENPARLLATTASLYYGRPSEKFELIGVTGTNGKTTITSLLYQLFRQLGYKCGLISTTGIWIENEKQEATHTTPDSIKLNALMADMAEADCDYVFMEVSSHAVSQERTYGLHFTAGIFSNLTHDHLDYHGTFENYRDAKKAFFDQLPPDAVAITNADDKNGRFMLQNTKAIRMAYALKNPADFKGKIIEFDLHGMLLQLDGQEIYTSLSGQFNAYNLLAVYALAHTADIPRQELLTALSSLRPAEGRFHRIPGKWVTGIVDYAHTPDALQNVLESIRDINLKLHNIITVIGCGGNRDTAKRPIMAKIASELSDQVILTSDNPRNEDPEEIIKEMEAGIPFAKKRNTLSITDRRQAIKTACTLAREGDIILVAGKGHEKYQEIKGVRYEFDDSRILAELINETEN